MTKTEKHQTIRSLSEELRTKELFHFLASYDARLLSRLSGAPGRGSILLYLINTYMVIVTINPDGWEIFLPASKQNSVVDTLKAAEEFLGARPGDLAGESA
jgi:hypothetical protein